MIEGKSISELEQTAAASKDADLLIISRKNGSRSWESKKIAKADFDKAQIAGKRDDAARSTTTSKSHQVVDEDGKTISYMQSALLANGNNQTMLRVQKDDQYAHIISYVDAEGDANTSIKSHMTTFRMDGTLLAPGYVQINSEDGCLELFPKSSSGKGGHIDFHYNGTSQDFTSKIEEQSDKLQVCSNDKNVEIVASSASKQVILNAAANNSVLQASPTLPETSTTSKAIATVGWVASKFLPQSAFIDPTSGIGDLSEQLELLRGLLNKKNLIIYVDSSSGNTFGSSSSYVVKDIPGTSGYRGVYETSASTRMRAVKSIYDAIAIAQKMKFLENSNCIIRLLTNCSFYYDSNGKYKQINFSHPDLVQTKGFTVTGWQVEDGGYNSSTFSCSTINGTPTLRSISIDLNNTSAVLGNTWYSALVSVNCQVAFHYIRFFGGLDKECFWDGESFSLKNEYAYDSYFVRNYSQEQLIFRNCVFNGCDYAVVGTNLDIQNVAFTLCKTCVLALSGPRCIVYGPINISYCVTGFYATQGGLIFLPTNLYKPLFRIQTSNAAFQIYNSGQMIISLYSDINDMALKEDPNGSIKIDGQKYSRAPSAGEATKVNPNLAGLHLLKIVGLDSSNIAVSQLIKLESTSDRDLGDFFEGIVGPGSVRANGYSSNGYLNISFGESREWLKLYSESGEAAGLNDWVPSYLPLP